MVNINIGPDDIIKWFHSLTSLGQIVTVLIVPIAIGLLVGWLVGKAFHHREVGILERQHAADQDLIAEYREKLKGASPQEAASKLADLENEIRLLKQSRQRTVSRDQWTAIRQVLTAAAQKQQRLSLSIKVPYGDLEAEKYGKDFMQIFNCGISYDNKIGPDLVGLIIRVTDRNSIPPTASYLSQALKAAHIDHRTDSLDLQFPLHTEFEAELVIGPNG
jgi:hypothetical protein